jgi:hypothetical protein
MLKVGCSADRINTKLKMISESLGLWTLSIIRDSEEVENATFRKLDFFPSSGKEETHSLLCPLRRANLSLNLRDTAE